MCIFDSFCDMNRIAYILFILLLVSCGSNSQKTKKVEELKFVVPTPPALITEISDKMEYITVHFWDNFFANTSAITDSSHILGVKDLEVEQAVGNYLTLLNEFPVDKAQGRIAALFSKLEKTQANQEGESHLFLKFSDLIVRYLYDPNSPHRSEDLYLPFVEGLTKSKYTLEEKRRGYEFELEKCRLNPYGAIAPDFEFKDIKGHRFTLHGVKSQFTLLFFSNPGCNACLEIIDQIGTRPYIEAMIKDKFISIVNIYIDDEMDKWRDYVPTYPSSWLNCYDSQKKIKDDLYYVRAIPSLYLLDKDKRVLFKDAPVEKVLNYFDKLINNQ